MRPIAYLTLSFAPIIATFLYFYFKKRSDNGFERRLLYSYLLGACSVALLIAAIAFSAALKLDNLVSLKRIVFFAVITVAGSSELGKFLVLRYLIADKKENKKPIDTITFSIMTALGFSSVVLILFSTGLFDMQNLNLEVPFPVTLYAFIYVFATILFSVIMGFFTGMARFLKGRFVYSLTGLLGALVFHGIFNFCLLTSDFKLLSLFSFGSTVIVFFLTIKAANTDPEPSN
jgi:RsiW-degrading membrane proteinase PrsW (M82 family)